MKRSASTAGAQRQELDALGALGDPMRRTIFETIAARPRSVREIADVVPISRPSVSVHLKVMKQAGLVTEVASGTRHIYQIDPRGIAAMRAWLEDQWGSALKGLQAQINTVGRENHDH
jgi:DNA-binding transcriptional ArsR family regulator